jgi:glycine cleavage system H protein
MNAPANLKYTKSDEWFDPATGKARHYRLRPGSTLRYRLRRNARGRRRHNRSGQTHRFGRVGQSLGRDLRPAGGKVAAVNKGLSDKPESINSDPFGEAWMIQLEGGSEGETMDAAAYEKYCEERTTNSICRCERPPVACSSGHIEKQSQLTCKLLVRIRQIASIRGLNTQPPSQ